MAKYVCKSEGKWWTSREAKSLISDSIQMSQTVGVEELEKVIAEESEMYPISPTIALAYLSVLKDREAHCHHEGSEVKRLGGLHVIGTSLHESRRIDNQVLQRRGQGYSIIVSSIPKDTKASYSLRDPYEVMAFFVMPCKVEEKL